MNLFNSKNAGGKMLKLVIDNTKRNCRMECDLYDDLTDLCSISVDADISNPAIISSCRYFLSRKMVKTSLNETAVKQLIQKGSVNTDDNWLYPLFPDEPAEREDAVWFVSPCTNYGCWIINHSKQGLIGLSSSPTLFAEDAKTYRSLHPLHNHNAPITLASRVVWYVNRQGYGAYMLLNKGKLVPIQKNTKKISILTKGGNPE